MTLQEMQNQNESGHYLCPLQHRNRQRKSDTIMAIGISILKEEIFYYIIKKVYRYTNI